MISLQQAILVRRSRRTYLPQPIPDAALSDLERLIFALNKRSGLHMQLLTHAHDIFSGLTGSYGMFHGVTSCLALVGRRDDPLLDEKAGYYGERVVLECTRHELGTCWVGGTFKKAAVNAQIAPDEALVCVVAIGCVRHHPSLRETLLAHTIHRHTKPMDAMYSADELVPMWFLEGMRAVQLAPSAMNRQPVQFAYREGNVYAHVDSSHEAYKIDLGIAKLHFELGSGHRVVDV